MKKLLLLFITVACATAAHAIDNDNVEIVFNGTTATVTVADNIANDITVSSGTSSHVIIKSDTESVEIIYSLKGTKSSLSCGMMMSSFGFITLIIVSNNNGVPSWTY